MITILTKFAGSLFLHYRYKFEYLLLFIEYNIMKRYVRTMHSSRNREWEILADDSYSILFPILEYFNFGIQCAILSPS